MTIKEAILKSLEDLKKPVNNSAIYKHIIDKKYYFFKKGRTPEATISAQLSNFIKDDDSRVKRVRNTNKNGRGYQYYLSKYEDIINFDEKTVESRLKKKELKSKHSYNERDLHKLLSSYLKNRNIYSKTILHEKSKNSKDNPEVDSILIW